LIERKLKMAEVGRLQQRHVLITGAASGIGRSTALLFAAEGTELTLLDRSLESLLEVARETGGLAVAADVTEEGSVEQGAAAMGGTDGAVNAARGHAP
jgi:NADP-dependent 3-hydroxy acid dehydrogenase YdfG